MVRVHVHRLGMPVAVVGRGAPVTAAIGARNVPGSAAVTTAGLVCSREEATMKDIRCLLGYHDYVKKQVEDSQYLECRRCGKDAPTKPGDAGTA